MASRNDSKGLLALAVDDITFLPSPEQRKAKAAFWAAYTDNPVLDLETISSEEARRYAADTRVYKWWPIPGFRDWFLNKDEFRQRLEYLANIALDAAEEILLNPTAHPSARTNMAKLVIEAAGRMPNKFAKEPKFADEIISRMTRRELEEYIRRGQKLLGTATPLLSDESTIDDGSTTTYPTSPNGK